MHKCIPLISVLFLAIIGIVGIVIIVNMNEGDNYAKQSAISPTGVHGLEDNPNNRSEEVHGNESEDKSTDESADRSDVANHLLNPNLEIDNIILTKSTIRPTFIDGSGDGSVDLSMDIVKNVESNVEIDNPTPTQSILSSTLMDGSGDLDLWNWSEDIMKILEESNSNLEDNTPTEEPSKMDPTTMASSLNQTTNRPKLKVSLYYETMCPDCQRWISDQLCPVVEKLYDYFYIDFVPYGNVQPGSKRYDIMSNKFVVSCQHGPDECEGNRIQACAIKYLSYLQSTKFICCHESESDFEPRGINCLKKLGIDIPTILICADGLMGEFLHDNNGFKTSALSPSHRDVPWIIFNDRFEDDDEMTTARNDFKSVLCKYIPVPKPAECTVDDDDNSQYYDYDYQ